MYQMLAGRVPFDSAAEIADVQQAEIARQHRANAAPPLRSVRPDVPEELEAVIAKCMAKSPSEHWRTPGELAGVLAGMFRFAAPDAPRAASSPPVQVSPSPRPSRPSGPPPLLDRKPANPPNRAALLAAIGFGALIVILALVVMASRPGDDEPSLPPRIMAVSPPTHTPTAETTSTADANAPANTPALEPTVPPANTPAPEPTAAPTNTPASAPSSQTQAATGDAAGIFQSALTAMNALTSYRAEMEYVVSGMMGMQGEIRTEVQADVIPPDSMGGDMTITLTGEPPIANSFMVIGDEAYISLTDPDNPQNLFWVQSSPADVEAVTSFLTWFETGAQYEFTPSEPVGTEDLNGEETRRLRGAFVVQNLLAGTEQPDNMVTDVWIGTSDNLIRKIAGSGSVEDVGMGLEITISYSRFDDSAIQIERPTDFIAP